MTKKTQQRNREVITPAAAAQPSAVEAPAALPPTAGARPRRTKIKAINRKTTVFPRRGGGAGAAAAAAAGIRQKSGMERGKKGKLVADT